MHAFKDCRGRTWELSITLGSLERLKGSPLQIDLTALALERMEEVVKLMQDAPRFVHAVYVLCRAEDHDCSQEDFADGFDGDALLAAEDAFREELIGFFRHPKEREALRKMLDRGREMGNRMLDAVGKRIDRLDFQPLMDQTEAKMDEVESKLKTLTDSSGSSPASSA